MIFGEKIFFPEKFNGDVDYAQAPQFFLEIFEVTEKKTLKSVMINNVMILFIAWWLENPAKISGKNSFLLIDEFNHMCKRNGNRR